MHFISRSACMSFQSFHIRVDSTSMGIVPWSASLLALSVRKSTRSGFKVYRFGLFTKTATDVIPPSSSLLVAGCCCRLYRYYALMDNAIRVMAEVFPGISCVNFNHDEIRGVFFMFFRLIFLLY